MTANIRSCSVLDMLTDAATQRTPALAAVPTDTATTPVTEPDGRGVPLSIVRRRHPANGLHAVRAGPGAAGDPVAAALCALALRLEVATVESERLLDRTPLKRRSPVRVLRSAAEPEPTPQGSRPPGTAPPPPGAAPPELAAAADGRPGPAGEMRPLGEPGPAANRSSLHPGLAGEPGTSRDTDRSTGLGEPRRPPQVRHGPARDAPTAQPLSEVARSHTG